MAAFLTHEEIDWLRSLPRWDYLNWLNAAASENSAAAEELERLIGRSRHVATKLEVADFFGISPECVELWQRKGMPYEQAQKAGEANRYDLRQAATWLADQRTIKTGGDADEAFREEKTHAARLKRLQLEGTLVEAEKYEARIANAIQIIRKGIDSFHQTFGDTAVMMLHDICDSAERCIKGEITDTPDLFMTAESEEEE